MVLIQVGTKVVDVPPGSSLPQVCTEHPLPIVFGCRAGRCGSCLVQVLSGATNLCTPNLREARTLDVLDAEPDWRLACQCIAFGDVRLRYV